jgi:acetyltransferase
LLRRLIGVGRDEGLVRIYGDILASNAGMLRVSQRAGFTLRRDPQTATVEATLTL